MKTTTNLTNPSDQWETPEDLFDAINNEYGFTLDVAATAWNNKLSNFYNELNNSLVQDWIGTVWLNPPYSRGNINAFMRKALNEFKNGNAKAVVALVRLDPSANWFTQFVHGQAHEIRMFPRRVKFVGASSGYPFPCCLVVYDESKAVLDEHGNVVTQYKIWDW